MSLLLSHLLLIASLDEEYMSLLLSSNIITDKMCLNLRLQDTIALKLTLSCYSRPSYHVVIWQIFQPQRQKDFFLFRIQ